MDKVQITIAVLAGASTLWVVAGLIAFSFNGSRRKDSDRAWFWDQVAKFVLASIFLWWLLWMTF